MKLSYLALVPLSAVWVLAAAQAPADLLQSTFAKMDAASARFKGMTADVKKVNHLDAIAEDDVVTGTMAVKRVKPKELHMRVDEKEPDRRIVCFADHKGEVYNPNTNSVQIYDVSKKNGSIFEQFLLLGFGSGPADIQRSYKIALGGPDQVNGQKTVRLELTPKSRDQLGTITKVELWISEAPETSGLAVQQKFYQQGRDFNLVTYSNMKLSSNLPDAAVKCELPKDVQKEYPMGR
jgi:outer membrane lipoprotein-sorting protein